MFVVHPRSEFQLQIYVNQECKKRALSELQDKLSPYYSLQENETVRKRTATPWAAGLKARREHKSSIKTLLMEVSCQHYPGKKARRESRSEEIRVKGRNKSSKTSQKMLPRIGLQKKDQTTLRMKNMIGDMVNGEIISIEGRGLDKYWAIRA